MTVSATKPRARARDANGVDDSDGAAAAKSRRVDGDSQLFALRESAAVAVFAVQLLTHRVLAALDAASVVRFATFLRSRSAWRHVLSDELLWRELLVAHFGGPVRALQPAPTEADGYSDSDADVSDDEDEDVNEEPDDSDNGGAEDDSDATGSDHETAAVSRTSTVRRAVARLAPPSSSAAAAPVPGAVLELPIPLFACQSLVHFARASRLRQRFAAAVHVVAGDIGTIAEIGDRRIDGIAFASSGYLRNPLMGVANVVFQRAGRGLDEHVNAISEQIHSGQVYVTPGFAAGVDKLIHCAGPVYMGGRGVPLLAMVYENVLQAAVRERLSCVAMTSISTGNLGFPLREAAATGMRALQRFVREHEWPGTIGVVCFETEVFNEFTRQRQLILDAFNAE
ncbi:hypothetical protein PybrP1_002727 [[Pythium] brassicae (nom. inval.)]|nr:hypothetical protein PybrP1_002727 [[Pythium] brassicae (nom. inval.)]